jgi:hypothetical protein
VSRLAEVVGILLVWFVCVMLFALGIDLPWVIIIALIGFGALAIVKTRSRR